MDNPMPTKRPNLESIEKQKITCLLVNFAVQDDIRVKVKEGENIKKYVDFDRAEKLLNMKMTVIPVVVNALGTVHKDF